MSAFSTKAAKVLIVEESGSGRQLLSDVVRGFGFQDVVVAATGRDALDILEIEPIDWLLMPLLRNQDVNALHLLKVISEQPDLRQTRVSLIFDASDEPYLDAAFANGLMSCHPKTYLREELHEEIRRLLETLKNNGWQPVLAAAEYLRLRLIKPGRQEALVNMEKSLLELYPGSATLLLKLGEAQLLTGDGKEGTSTLRQASIIDERLKDLTQALLQKFQSVRPAPEAESGTTHNALAIKNCVLIDPDTAVLSLVTSLLESVGVPKVETFDDGEAAWEWLQANPEPGLILQEWRVPGVAGPLLLQRIRQQGFIRVPIIVTSSVIKPAELPLLREMGVDNVIPKPFGQQLFFKNVIWTVQQSQLPTEQKSLERKIRRLLEAGETGEAERLRISYMLDRRFPTAAKKQMEAEFAYYGGHYRQGRDIAIEALRLSGDSLLLLNLIGKCLLKLGDHGAALKFFEKANALSPLNIEHLCNMAVSRFESGAKEDAAAYLEKAKTIDPGNRMAGEIDCQHAIIGSEVERAKELMGQLQSVGRVVGYMNNRAIALTRSGRYDEGIDLYRQTMASLPGDWSDTHDIVAYNLGLAFARYGDLDKAQEQLKPVCERPASPLHRKAVSLSKRIGQVKEKGTPLPLFSQERSEAEVEVESGEAEAEEPIIGAARTAMAAALEIRRGDVCLKGIFQTELNQDSAKLLEASPRFKSRTGFDRPETFKQ